jgi:tripeptidyl-peptidase I
MCGTFKPTNVISIAYGWSEKNLPASYQKRPCLEILKLSLQGVTVVVAAGDSGVGTTGTCIGDNHDIFIPFALATCPYAFSVGATLMTNNTAAGNKSNKSNKTAYVETAPTTFSTGGGFSNLFSTPDYQQSAVTSYLARANLSFEGYTDNVYADSAKYYNRSGRGYPDVSAVGTNFVGLYRGSLVQWGGTSTSTPLWAAVVTQVNEARLRANKTTVGFLHSVLYKHPEVFTDVVEGSNPGCGSTGFVATPGWDPVSGLG